MRKTKFFISGLILAMSFAVLSGCGKKTEDIVDDEIIIEENQSDATDVEVTVANDVEEDTSVEEEKGFEEIIVDEEAVSDGEEKYAEVLKRYRDYVINFDESDSEMEEGFYGMAESIMYGGDDTIGYTFMDVNNDGEDELIIANINDLGPGYGDSDCGTIFAMWSLIDNSPKLIFESLNRSSYTLLKDGRFVYMGSNGAMYSGYAIYSFNSGAESLITDKFYFTDVISEESGEMGYFVNNKGLWDRDGAEPIDEDTFWDGYDLVCEDMAVIRLKYLIDKEMYGVGANYAGKVYDSFDMYEKYNENDDEMYSNIIAVYTSDSAIKGAKVYKLSLEDVDNNGNGVFGAENVYNSDKFDIDNPIILKVIFPGDTPAYGISFTDKDGIERNVGISISGKDGSVVLSNIIIR